MKQTNNALKFLLAQYRAVFKNAYFKGLTTAMVVTAGLAAGQAQASFRILNSTELSNLTTDATIDGTTLDTTMTGDKYGVIRLQGSATWNKTITIQGGIAGGAKSGNYIIDSAGSGNAVIGGSGSLIIDGTDAGVTIGTYNTNAQNVTLSLGSIEVKEGTLDVKDSLASNVSGATTVIANDIKVGADGIVKLASVSGAAVTLGNTSSEIALDGGLLEVSTSGANTAYINGTSLTIGSGATMKTLGTGTTNSVIVNVDDFTVKKDAFKVIGDGNKAISETFAGHTGTISGNVLINASGAWTLAPKAKDNVAGSVTFTEGSRLQISNSGSASVSVKAGTLTIEKGAELIGFADNNGANIPSITIDAQTQTSANKLGTSANLTIDPSVLGKFLKGDVKYNKILVENGKGSISSAQDTSVAGSLVLTSGATVNFTDKVNLSDFNYSGGNVPSGSAIVISGSSVDASTLKGTDVTIDKGLTTDGNTVASALNLDIEAETLTLGGGIKEDKSAFVSSDNDLGFAETAYAKNVIFKQDNTTTKADFTLQNKVALSAIDASGETPVADEGVIDGNVIVSTNGSLAIEAGTYTNNNSITLATGGTLAVGNGEDVAASLKQNGVLNLNGGEVVVSGSTKALANLDITGVSADDVGVSGTASKITAEQGTVKVTGVQLSKILNVNNTSGAGSASVTLDDGGVLDIAGNLQKDNAPLDVSKITATPADATAGQIGFSGAGTVKAERVWLGTSGTTALNIGKGTIEADIITLDNATESGSTGSGVYNTFVVSGGNFVIGQQLNSRHIDQGNGLVLNGANVTLGRDGSVEGSITQDLTLQNGAKVAVDVGSWELTGGLKLNNLNDTVSLAKDTGLKTTTFAMNNGEVRVNESASFTVVGEHTEAVTDAKGNVTTPESFGVNIKGGTINVAGGTVTFESTAVGGLTFKTKDADGKDLDGLATHTGFDVAAINLTDNGTLRLNGLTSDDGTIKTSFSMDDLKSLRSTLIKNSHNGESVVGGHIDLGNVDLEGLSPVEGTISYDQYRDLATNYGDLLGYQDIITDKLSQATLTDVRSNLPISANVGNIKANNGVDTVVIGNTSLFDSNANGSNGNFIFSANEAITTPLNANVQNNGQLALNNGGAIGSVNLGNDAKLYVKSASGDTTIAAITGTGSLVDIKGVTNVAGNVAAAQLNVDQTLTVGGNTTVSELTSTVTVTDGIPSLPVTTGSLTTNKLTVNGDVVYGGSITATDVEIAGGLNANAEKDYPIAVGKLTANNLKVGGKTHYFGDIEVSNKTSFGDNTSLMGNNSFKDVDALGNLGFYASPNATDETPDYTTSMNNLTFKGDTDRELEIEDGVTVSAGVIQGKTAADNSSASLTINVGTDAGSYTNYDGSIDTWDASTGYLMADRIDLAGGMLRADPEYGQAVTIVTAGALGPRNVSDATSAGELDGAVLALQNSIVALGVDRKDADGNDVAVANVRKDFEQLLSGGSLQADNIGSILYVAKSINVKDGSQLIADATVSNAGNGAIDTSKYDGADAYIGAHSAIAVNATSAQQTDTEGKVTKAAVNFQKENAKVYADKDAKIVLVGNFDVNKAVKVFDDTKDGVEFAKDSAKEIAVTSASGLYKGTMVADETTNVISDDVSLEYIGSGDNNGGNDNTPDPWAGVSTPVHATLDTYAKFIAANPDYDYDSDFLYYAVRDDVVSAEKVARLGAFGGAAQAAIAAGSTTYEAVSGRMGVGANGTNITVADNTQGAALWLTPVYKNRDSDGFGADGVEYGADLDLYGVALGADYTLANGFKVGAAFNIGSGDADGNGAGEGVSNDFDYYGFAIYGGYTYGSWSVVADISYTNVDNDVDVTTDLGKFDTSFDSSNLSVGVTAQYQAVLDGDVTVTPHAGLRYTKIDLDDYTVTGEDGDPVAAYSSDDLSIFSIPFGVTVAKEFVNGTWTVKPSFDLTLTANMGDDSADGSVYWGVTGLENTAVSSEVLDNFTYGATVGVAAKSGNFSLGFGLNYTGSSNTDEFGVNANARFVF